MFQPASLKGISPVPIDEKIRRKFLPFYFIIIIFSIIPTVFFEFYYFEFMWNTEQIFFFFLLLPFNLFIAVYILQISALFISKLVLVFCNLIHRPKEGVFERNIEDKDYFYWNIRNMIKKWALYVTASNPFPWLKNRFTLRVFGVKIGKNCICDNAWISSEFVKIGNNVLIGMGSTIISFGMAQDKFFLKRITIEDKVGIGAKCVILPGAHLKKNAKVSAHSYVDFEQTLLENCTYNGHPAELEKNKKR